MGLLVVFFPEENPAIVNVPHKTKLLSSSSSSFSRTNPNVLLSKAQSTISICAILFLITLILFALSTIESTSKSPATRILLQDPTSKSKSTHWWRRTSFYNNNNNENFGSPALQRMGTLYRRGNRAMSDLVVGHVPHDTTDDEFRLFLRLIHRSGLTAKSDVVFIFASNSLSSRFAPIIRQENHSFFTLIDRYTQTNNNNNNATKQSRDCFDVTRFFFKKATVELGEPLWGKKRIRETEKKNNESLSYGSVLGFDPSELDPENSLAGFLNDAVPLSLRRWACYPMLLGRVKRAFKNVMMIDVKNVVVVNDPLTRVRNRSPESVLLYDSERTQYGRRVNSGIIMGGARGVRGLSNAMLIEIVRAAMKQQEEDEEENKNVNKKKKRMILSESAILGEVAGKEYVLKNVNLMMMSESTRAVVDSGGATSLSDYVMIERNEGDVVNEFLRKQICRCALDSAVYGDSL